MALAIISELDLATADAARIEGLRRRHDPQQPVVAAHFTLVFPFEGLDRTVVEAHAARIADQTAPIAFHLRRSAAVQDPLGPLSRLFLLPEAGRGQLVALHDALYAGPLSAHLRSDIAYTPHITVGAFPTQDLARAAKAEVGVLDIVGKVSAFDLVAFDGRTVNRLRRFALG